MKYLAYIVLALIIISCQPPDDGPFFDSKRVTQDNLVTIDGDGVFNVGDIIWIESTHPTVFQTDTGENIDLEALQSPNNESVSYAYFELYKQSGFENPQIISLSPEEVVSEIGNAEASGTQILAYLKSNYEDGEYRARIGIKLKEAGDFYLQGLTDGNKVQFYVDGLESSNVVFITTIEDADMDQRYHFTVVE